jgi:mannose-6-phosphate isomerase-like protein (cupin superfamily)
MTEAISEAMSSRAKGAVIHLDHKLSLFAEQWSPRVVTEFNENQLKLTKLQGEFIWHSHHDTDEVFLVLAGEMEIDFRDRIETLHAGDLLVVPRGVEHRPRAERECHVLLIEPRGVVNTGDAGGLLTAPNNVWV